MTNILHNPPVVCLIEHPDDWGPIVRRCRRVRGHDDGETATPHSSEPESSPSLGDEWIDEMGAA